MSISPIIIDNILSSIRYLWDDNKVTDEIIKFPNCSRIAHASIAINHHRKNQIKLINISENINFSVDRKK